MLQPAILCSGLLVLRKGDNSHLRGLVHKSQSRCWAGLQAIIPQEMEISTWGESLNKPSHKLEKWKTGKFYAGEQFKTNGQISHISVAELLQQWLLLLECVCSAECTGWCYGTRSDSMQCNNTLNNSITNIF